MGSASNIARPDVNHDFSAFYEAEFVGQVRSATLIVGSRSLALDLVHDVFVTMFERWHDIEDPGPYLQRSVVNACRDSLRRQRTARRHLRLQQRVDVSIDYDVPLYDALARLPFHHRAAVVLRYFGGLTEAEIAERLGCRPGSVGPWIRRALDRLSNDLRPTKESS